MPTYETDGLRLFYEDVGQGPPLVFIHGFALSSEMFVPQREGLKQHFRVITPDLRGAGRSTAPRSGYSMDRYADDVAGLLTHLGLDRVLLGGMSMGGYIVMSFLGRYSQRVKGVILIDTQAEADDEKKRAKRRALINKVRAEGAQAVTETDKLFSDQTHAERPELVEHMRRIMEQSPPDGLVGALTAILERPDFAHMLEGNPIPALIFVGSDDPLTPPEDAHAMEHRLPNAKVVVLEGAAHGASLEQPEIVNDAIRDWAAGVE